MFNSRMLHKYYNFLIALNSLSQSFCLEKRYAMLVLNSIQEPFVIESVWDNPEYSKRIYILLLQIN